jgi:hypothetical protein
LLVTTVVRQQEAAPVINRSKRRHRAGATSPRRFAAAVVGVALGAGAAVTATGGTAGAAAEPVVRNPGPVTVTINGGRIGVGGFDIDLPACSGASCPSFAVTVAADGTFQIPLDWIALPSFPVTLPVDGLGEIPLEIGIGPTGNGQGVVNPVTGAASLSLGLAVSVTFVPPPPYNFFGAISCPVLVLPLQMTSGTSDALSGNSYNPTTGRAGLVDGDFGPQIATTGPGLCPLVLPLITSAIGGSLPDLSALSGAVRLDVTMSPAPKAPFAFGKTGFTDVPDGSFFDMAVRWLAHHGLTTGFGNDLTSFAPHVPTTRGQVAAFLHRIMGSPAVTAPCGFDDVPAGAFYEMGVCWLKQQGLTTGVGGDSTRYEPDRDITRGELATVLWRLTGQQTVGATIDVDDVPGGAFFAAAVKWMFHHGLTTGFGGNASQFRPDDPIDRAQLATFLFRLATVAGAWGPTTPPVAVMVV